ncbi:hypothetical protein BSK20_01590 [SR1 bacterium human oral taxon HOT-345]|nr:hypothetical protein BSK20_01590 [SR1 bacterium human oral taxon HOT-345]
MKNIVIIIPSLQFGGGAEKVASILGTELHKEGYDISYLTFYDSKEKYPFKGTYYTLNEDQTSSFFGKIKKLFTRALKIKKFCKEHKINTVISLMEDANIPTIISSLFGNDSKMIVSIHHSIAAYGKGLYRLCIKYLYRFADTITVLTSYERQQLTQNFKIPAQKVQIIPNGLNLDEIKEKQKAALPAEYTALFENKKFTFISVGRLNPIKNQSLMIQSFIKLNKKYPDTQLIILGEGELRPQLEKEIGDNSNVYLLGNHENIFPFLMKSDCFLLSSLSESFSLAILEAMASGLPIISTKTQGPKDILGENTYGITTPNNDKTAFSSAMELLLNDKECYNSYKEQGRKRYTDFSSDKIVEKRKSALEN